MQFASINGNSVHYAARGITPGKPVIVFINSLGSDFRIWDDVIATLGENYGSLTYDKRGHGLSDTGTTPYAISDLSADLAGLMDHLGLSGAIVCGLSVGGQIAQQLYHDRPDLVAGLVLSNTAARIGDADFWAQRIALIEQQGLEPVAPGILERWFSPAFRADGNPAFPPYRNMLIRQPVAGYLATCAAIRDFDRRADAGSITVPVACLVGEFDGATPPALVEDLARSIPGATFELIEGVGHIPCVERADRVADIIGALARRTHKGDLS